ncbi:asparagine synthase (glutamine-hydrolyzing) [uncultured Microbacterium sp.]|uniref:asparagine synthase (glutamine-hydrolyzing) n=1 Tax=uncultured Microbacterium sp. TaxID=191216 RepID=UPI0026213246|nr:asparagine synthase (glutamine-hydrolyzing) [uncultured Microbacterium sp.]
MCGIAGIVDVADLTDDVASQQVQLMLAAIEHRGPDATEWVRNGAAVLGTVRLALVDKPTSRQPMTDPTGRWTLSFNGEIYNFRELREELERLGVEFRTDGDTEVLLQSLIMWGQRVLPRLRGQFAIAFWDSASASLLMARDRFGIVPLFWMRTESGALTFASEVKAFAAAGQSVPLSLSDVVDAGVLWGLHPGRSCFSGVGAVLPGGVLTLRDSRVEQDLYWEFAYAAERDARPLDEQAVQLRTLLATAIARRLPAYGDPAVLLSGGLDSSAVLAILRTEVPDAAIDSYSIRFASTALDEAPFQHLASERFGTNHDSISCDDEAIAQSLVDVVRHAEAPLVRTAPAASLRLATRLQSRATRAVLSGEGADELFCGYDLFKIAAIREEWARDPDGGDRLDVIERVMAQQKELGRAVERAFYERGIDHPDDAVFSHINRWSAAHRITQYLHPRHRDRFPLDQVLEGVRQRLPHAFHSWSAVEKAQFLEARYFLSHTLLADQCDRPYMACSVEARYPFLDEDIIDFALALPQDSKLVGTDEKRVLKRAVSDDVPHEIVERVKQPYTAPEGDAFRSPSGSELLEIYASAEALERYAIFDVKRVAWLIAKLRRGVTSFHDDLALLWIVSVQILASTYGVEDSSSLSPSE